MAFLGHPLAMPFGDRTPRPAMGPEVAGTPMPNQGDASAQGEQGHGIVTSKVGSVIEDDIGHAAVQNNTAHGTVSD